MGIFHQRIETKEHFNEIRNTYIHLQNPLIIQRTAKKLLTSDWSNMSNGRIENDAGLEQQVRCQIMNKAI